MAITCAAYYECGLAEDAPPAAHWKVNLISGVSGERGEILLQCRYARPVREGFNRWEPQSTPLPEIAAGFRKKQAHGNIFRPDAALFTYTCRKKEYTAETSIKHR